MKTKQRRLLIKGFADEYDNLVKQGVTMKILIVDDEEGLAEIIADIYRREGYECVTAETLEQALVLKEGITHALVDGLNGRGFELAKELHNNNVKVFSFSGTNSIKKGQEGVYCGIVEKPCSDEDLLKIVKG